MTAADLEALAMSLARLASDGGAEALDLAQDKAFEAMEAQTPEARAKLARQALDLSPLCADAYLVLARDATPAGEALEVFRQAVAAGAEALGEAVFRDEVGLFWSLIQTRPYMRARHELALALWASGAREEAVEGYRELLRLNPNDNQGVRYLLVDALLELGRDAEAAALLKRYKEDGSAAWVWSGALLAFRRAGNGAVADKALAKALDANPHVPTYLTGKTRMPRRLPEYIGVGDQDEAIAYVHGAAGAWAATPAAKAWVEQASANPKRGDAERPSAPAAGAAGAAEGDRDRIDEATLALLLLGLHQEGRAWKSFDWQAMDRLHAKGFISDPASRAKSVVFTQAGLSEARRLHRTLFGRAPNGTG